MTSTTRIYFAVPDHYTIGSEFDSYEEAAEAARSKILPFDPKGTGIEGPDTRAFVDVRLSDETGDRCLHRVEVFRDIFTPTIEQVYAAREIGGKTEEQRRELQRWIDDAEMPVEFAQRSRAGLSVTR